MGFDITIDWLKSVIGPERKYTAEEHAIAWARYKCTNLYYEISELYFKISDSEPHDMSKRCEEFGELLFGNDDLNPETGWILDDFYKSDGYDFNIFKTVAEEGIHAGDCTGLPGSCQRCFVDTFYKANTVTWTGKSAGGELSKAYHNYVTALQG